MNHPSAAMSPFTTYEAARATAYAWDEARRLAIHTPAYEAISRKQEEAFTAFMRASDALTGYSAPRRGTDGMTLPCQTNDLWDDPNTMGTL